MLAAKISRFRSRLLLLQNRNDLPASAEHAIVETEFQTFRNSRAVKAVMRLTAVSSQDGISHSPSTHRFKMKSAIYIALDTYRKIEAAGLKALLY
ncbi:hypothetical protein N7E02_07265 (plasmid) [Aliirhizobium terrae]|uniref:hypothetical protein n=1 Tax=Terrirhizobium terrae TaxID=2926709 RepID=UPI002577F4A9|nr:hypothetical protein [Rhizobium sp. CC-CFT758]WJH38893.1 hypothetical protein N7E02_07265 [Rhizobium sp. CC-CFT758]